MIFRKSEGCSMPTPNALRNDPLNEASSDRNANKTKPLTGRSAPYRAASTSVFTGCTMLNSSSARGLAAWQRSPVWRAVHPKIRQPELSEFFRATSRRWAKGGAPTDTGGTTEWNAGWRAQARSARPERMHR
jgi:hypothetical protein